MPLGHATSAAPKVVIVITNFNYARFLRPCVESALRQSHSSIEVMVVDDGSVDDSRDILSGLQTDYPELRVIFQENAGQAAAMNTGFAQTDGDWIIFLDADDVLEPLAISTAITAAKDGDFVTQFYLRTIDREGHAIGLHPFSNVLESGNVFPQICASGHFRYMPTSGNMFRRAQVEAIFPIPEKEWRICADTYLLLAGASRGSVCTVPEVLGSYRIHDTNAWYQDSPGPERLRQIIRNHLVVWRQVLELRSYWPASCDDHTLLSLVRRILASLTLHRASGALSNAEIGSLRRVLRRIIFRARVPFGEKCLHFLLLQAAGKKSSRLFQDLCVPPSRGLLQKVVAILRAPARHAWLARTPAPSEIGEMSIGRIVHFGQGGEGRKFEHYGFGTTENWRSWSSAERAGLIFRIADRSAGLTLSMDILPYISPPRLKSQRLEIRIKGQTLYAGEIDGRAKISIDLTAEMIGADGIVALEFLFPDAVIPAFIDPKSTVTRVTAIALESVSARTPDNGSRRDRYPVLQLGKTEAAANLLMQQPHGGWDCSDGYGRLYRRRGQIRFVVPNPVMERFVIRLEFERVPYHNLGDYRVGVELMNIGRDTIDLRETGTALLIIPRGKAPKSGLFDIICHAFDILPGSADHDMPPGPRLLSLVLQKFEIGPGKTSLWRSHQIVAFSQDGEGKNYMLAGWHPPDQRGAWTADTRATLGGLYFEDPGEVFLTLRLGTWSAGALPSQRVRILANSKVVFDREIGETEDVLAVVPAAFIGDDRYLKLEIESLFILSMRMLNQDDSPRNVGVCLEKLVIEPLAANRVCRRLDMLSEHNAG